MECLVAVWSWLGDNSGQVQTVIGVLAFLLAWKGYRKVLEQMKNSEKLEITANLQRGSELKIHALNVALNTLDRNANKIDSLKKYLALTEKSVNSDNECGADDINTLIETIKSKIKEGEELQTEIFNLCQALNEENVLHEYDALKQAYAALILISNDQLNVDLLKHNYVEIES